MMASAAATIPADIRMSERLAPGLSSRDTHTASPSPHSAW